jgi:uncharacterized membrane protein (UPF0182 family)
MIVIGEQPLRLPVAGILRLVGLAVSLLIAVVTGASVMMEWPTFALYWYAPPTTGGVVDPIFGKPVNFYLFTLPAWQFITGWLLTLAALRLVRQQLYREAKRTGSRATLHHPQHRPDAAGLWIGPSRAARISG